MGVPLRRLKILVAEQFGNPALRDGLLRRELSFPDTIIQKR
jgi:hypothetical protein